MWRAVGLFGWSIADTHHWLTCYGCSPLQVQPAALRAARPAALSPKGAPTMCQALCARHHRHILSCATLTSPRMVLGRVTRRSRHATIPSRDRCALPRRATIPSRDRRATIPSRDRGDLRGPVGTGGVGTGGAGGCARQRMPGGKQADASAFFVSRGETRY